MPSVKKQILKQIPDRVARLEDSEQSACTPEPIRPDKFNRAARIPYGCTVEHIKSARLPAFIALDINDPRYWAGNFSKIKPNSSAERFRDAESFWQNNAAWSHPNREEECHQKTRRAIWISHVPRLPFKVLHRQPFFRNRDFSKSQLRAQTKPASAATLLPPAWVCPSQKGLKFQIYTSGRVRKNLILERLF